MQKINRQLAIIVTLVGFSLVCVGLVIDVTEQSWFVFLMALWSFVFCSCCYRLTPLFIARNTTAKFIKRDQCYVMFFSLTGFYDFTTGPFCFLIESIEQIKCTDGACYIYVETECVYCTSLPSSRTQLLAHFNSLLTEHEKQTIVIH